jgi:hypothetical protein
MRIQSAVKCHCYLTQKQHTTIMQPSGAVPLSHTQYRNTRHNDISLLWPERGNREFILEFSGLYHYQLREGRKPKCSEKTPDDLFIRRLIPVWKFLAATVVRTTAVPAAHSLPAVETGAKPLCQRSPLNPVRDQDLCFHMRFPIAQSWRYSGLSDKIIKQLRSRIFLCSDQSM